MRWARSGRAEPRRDGGRWRRPRWPCGRDRRRKSRRRQTGGSHRPRPPNTAGRRIRRWSPAKAAATLRARRGRRRGRARSASRRRNPVWGPPPGSKCIASNRPPKAQGFRQAFDIDRVSKFADGKVERHHKAFSGEVETGSFPLRTRARRPLPRPNREVALVHWREAVPQKPWQREKPSISLFVLIVGGEALSALLRSHWLQFHSGVARQSA